MNKTIPFLPILLSIIIAFLLLGCFSLIARAVAPNHGYVIVQPNPNQRWIREIEFDSSINGLEALQLANQDVITASTSFGVAVCSIAGVGCPADNCFCSASYWAYSYWNGSAWQDYGVGPGDSNLGDGAVEGWRWGEWGSTGIPPANHLIASEKALDYLLTLQGSDGGYGSNSSTMETLLSIASNNISPTNWKKPGNQYPLAQYLLRNGASYSAVSAAAAGKFAIGISGSQWCSPFKTQSPSKNYNPVTGIYDEGAGNQSLAMLGAKAINETIPSQAVTYLKSLQKSDGSFEWGTGYGYDTNSTSIAIQALIAGGEAITSTSVVSGLNYLQSAQNTDGGFPFDPISTWSTASDANSTAYAIQAIIAAGQDPQSPPWVQSGGNPIDFLLSLQLPDGSFEWQEGSGANTLATQQAIPALLHRPFPLNSKELSQCPINTLPVIFSSNSN